MQVISLLFPILLTTLSTKPTLSSNDVEGMNPELTEVITDSEYWYGVMRGRFGVAPWVKQMRSGQLPREGRKQGAAKGPKTWPNARIPYEFSPTIDTHKWRIMQNIFSNYSSVTNLRFVPRTSRDEDYLLITEDIEKWGCGCCSIGLGYLEGSGPHVLVLAPVSEGGCGVNTVGGTHELLHILGFSHTQNRPDRCNYIDINTDLLKDWGEWRPALITQAADWFTLRMPYDCSSYVHYYQLQGAFWKKDIEKKVDKFMEEQGCENNQRGQYLNSCLVSGGYTLNGRVIKDGWERCYKQWDIKHAKCVERVKKKYPTFDLIDPNGRCKENGINRAKRKSHELSEWDVWAINAAYGGPLPSCRKPKAVGNGVCNTGNNHVGCDYDGGDCCLPSARNRDCIDPCGVRDKFYGGKNRKCHDAPTNERFCSDHYWYGPNLCSPQYCKETEERFLQWQCKKTCGLCNVQPSEIEMDGICKNFAKQSSKKKSDARKKSLKKPNKNKSVSQTHPNQIPISKSTKKKPTRNTSVTTNKKSVNFEAEKTTKGPSETNKHITGRKTSANTLTQTSSQNIRYINPLLTRSTANKIQSSNNISSSAKPITKNRNTNPQVTNQSSVIKPVTNTNLTNTVKKSNRKQSTRITINSFRKSPVTVTTARSTKSSLTPPDVTNTPEKPHVGKTTSKLTRANVTQKITEPKLKSNSITINSFRKNPVVKKNSPIKSSGTESTITQLPATTSTITPKVVTRPSRTNAPITKSKVVTSPITNSGTIHPAKQTSRITINSFTRNKSSNRRGNRQGSRRSSLLSGRSRSRPNRNKSNRNKNNRSNKRNNSRRKGGYKVISDPKRRSLLRTIWEALG